MNGSRPAELFSISLDGRQYVPPLHLSAFRMTRSGAR